MSYPLASSDGCLAKTPKSVIVGLVQSTWPVAEASNDPLPTTALVIDAMCLIHSFPSSRLPKTFKEFFSSFLSQISAMRRRFNASRVDVVFDTYPAVSIKDLEHARRLGQSSQMASSLCRIIGPEQLLPKQWKEFLHHGQNKEELAKYLHLELLASQVSFDLFITLGDCCNAVYHDGKTAKIQDLHCDHVEADTRLFLHSKHAAAKHSTIIVSTTDSDVFIIGLCHVDKIPATVYLELGKCNI